MSYALRVHVDLGCVALQEATQNGGSPRAPQNCEGQPLAAVAAAATAAVAAPAVARGLKLTTAFLASLRTSKRHGRIDGYNDLHNKEEADDRNDQYADLVDSYYDLATEFTSGAGAPASILRTGEGGRRSRSRYCDTSTTASRSPEGRDCVLDCGVRHWGTGSNIARFTRAQVTGITINQFQVDRGNALCKQEGVSHLAKLVQGDFMNLPFKDNSFDGVYASKLRVMPQIEPNVTGDLEVEAGRDLRLLRVVPDGRLRRFGTPQEAQEGHRGGGWLPDLVHTSVCTKALADAGSILWKARLRPGWPARWRRPLAHAADAVVEPLELARFQFNPVMFFLMPRILTFLELIKLVAAGTSKTQVMLQAGGGCATGSQARSRPCGSWSRGRRGLCAGTAIIATRVCKRTTQLTIPRFSGAGGDSITGAAFSTFFSTLNFMSRRGVA